MISANDLYTVDSFIFMGTNFLGLRKTYTFVNVLIL